MQVLDFIFGVLLLIAVFIMFISWLGVKYDIAGRDEKNKQLQEELIKQYKKELQRKQKLKKKKGDKKCQKK